MSILGIKVLTEGTVDAIIPGSPFSVNILLWLTVVYHSRGLESPCPGKDLIE